MKNRFILTSCILLVCTLFASAQTAHSHRKDGDRGYKLGEYSKAEESYRRSLLEENTSEGKYNLGNSVYQQERFDEAIKHYNETLNSTSDNDIRARAYHNLGNAHFSKQEFDKSVDAFKNALRLEPEDMETKQNLAMAMRQLRLQQQQQQQQQNQDQEKNDEQKDQQQQQQQQQQDQQDQQQQSQQANSDDPSEEKNEQKQAEEEKDLSKEEAQQLLQIMGEEERKVLEKMRKAKAKPSKSDKDW